MSTTLLSIALLHGLVQVTPGTCVLPASQRSAPGQRQSAFFAGLGVTTLAAT
ncbi:hypothetical protein [Polaromonas sp.]|uniref:hypothetical protein n=1 Tax=Polaromonas sp. TaxID=1869339 RepID=UPI0024897354|nr:hypothetical protein [Polaromonas sp.]MDI1338434.1 hypothetical protein [Polaromonas sp.]